jgi:ssRNA-specific RNase YbeY (16S rRNA maturation enzyme)
MTLRLEEVFKISGVPTHTFVEPAEYNDLKVALRTAGRGVVVEGPSGIGKSTAVTKAISEVEHPLAVTKLSARVRADVEYIALLPDLSAFGLVVVDDFHKLPQALRDQLADLLKTLADSETEDSKLVIVGINQAGYSLIQHAPDLVNRIDTIKFEVEPEHKIEELVSLGEAALNIDLTAKESIVQGASGSFYLAQLLSHGACIQAGVLESSAVRRSVETLYTTVRRNVMERQEARFGQPVRDFARGTKFRPSGRAPYLHVLRWLADSSAWSINLRDEMARHPSERISVGQVVDKGFLENLCRQEQIADIVHLDPKSRILSVEDPLLIFYLRNLDWPAFVASVGFTQVDFAVEYDVALTFAGEDRSFAALLRDHLEAMPRSLG